LDKKPNPSQPPYKLASTINFSKLVFTINFDGRMKLKRQINLLKVQKNQKNEDRIEKKITYQKFRLKDEIENKSKFYKG